MGSLQDENGPITKFPASDLRSSQRFITSHNAAGDGVFIASDSGDHHRVMVNGKGVANIIYSTQGNPVDVADDIDITLAAKKEVRVSPFFSLTSSTVFPRSTGLTYTPSLPLSRVYTSTTAAWLV